MDSSDQEPLTAPPHSVHLDLDLDLDQQRHSCRRCRAWWPHCLVGIGVVLITLALIASRVVQYFIHNEVHKRMSLQPGSDTYAMWVEPSLPVYLEVYVFDLKNPLEVLAGEKPYVEQKGPYVYREHRKKFDIVHNSNGTITYKQNKTYFFDRERSVGWDNETFTTINMVYITVVEYMFWHGLPPDLSWLLELLDEDVFITRSVRDVAWGYQDKLLHKGKQHDPTRFVTDIVGVLAKNNNTDDGVYTIYSGVDDITVLGAITRYNGERKLDFWSSSSANMINGTDGTLSPPFISKDLTAYMFSTDICRSVYGVYAGTVWGEELKGAGLEGAGLEGVELWRFSAPPSVLASARDNPANAGFCTPRDSCMGGGVLNISSCQTLDSFHVPVVASLPHFHLADPLYPAAIGGLNPHQPHLTVDIDIEPISGVVMHIAKRLQINMYIRGNTGISQLESMRSMVYPILWVNETATIDAAHAHQVHAELLVPMLVASVIRYVVYGGGGVLILVAAAGCFLRRHTSKQHAASDSTAHRPDASGDHRDNQGDHVGDHVGDNSGDYRDHPVAVDQSGDHVEDHRAQGDHPRD